MRTCSIALCLAVLGDAGLAAADPTPVVRDLTVVPGQPRRLLVFESRAAAPPPTAAIDVLTRPDGRACCTPGWGLDAVRLAPAPVGKTFTLLTASESCVVETRAARLLRRGGEWRSGWEIDAAPCPPTRGGFYQVALEGRHPRARLVAADPVPPERARALLPPELRVGRVTVHRARSTPWLFVDAGPQSGERALVVRDGAIVAEHAEQYLGPLVLEDDTILVRYRGRSRSAAEDLVVTLRR